MSTLFLAHSVIYLSKCGGQLVPIVAVEGTMNNQLILPMPFGLKLGYLYLIGHVANS